MGGTVITADVVIPTYRRPSYVRTCLEHVRRQTLQPRQILVIDASPDDETYQIITRDLPSVRYLRNPFGAGTLATSRALSLESCTAEVVAFLDDDAYPRQDWLEQLLRPYLDSRVGAVGGRTLNGQPGEDSDGVDRIGKFLPDGTLTGYFAADPGHDIEVNHLLGANMSYRRSALHQIGGIHDAYPGTCLREDADTALRVGAAGWRLIFTPRAVVDHVGGTYAKGRRFDLRYTYYGQRNHLVLLARTIGFRDPRYRRYLGVATREIGNYLRHSAQSVVRLRPRGVAGGAAKAGAASAGLLVGVSAGLRQTRKQGSTP